MTIADGAILFVAAIALLLSAWQLISRHRPFVGTKSVETEQNMNLDEQVIVIIHNWGEIAAHSVKIQVSQEWSTHGQDQSFDLSLSWETPIFPAQDVELQIDWRGPAGIRNSDTALLAPVLRVKYQYNSSLPSWIPRFGKTGHSELWALSDGIWTRH